MVRPRTVRRQPLATVQLLQRVARELGDEVEIVVFGCDDKELVRMGADGGSRLRNLGILTREGVADAMRAADVFVDCSFYQAFGRTALEAMACGCTSVAPVLGGTTEFARDGENVVLVDSADRDAIFEAIRSLAGDRARLSLLQANAIRTAQRYSVPRAALSEYLLFEREYRRRFGGGEQASLPMLDEARADDA
jgi:glycosyltransferase involved in cell wall biosynthesis